jgi:hypothetical protein
LFWPEYRLAAVDDVQPNKDADLWSLSTMIGTSPVSSTAAPWIRDKGNAMSLIVGTYPAEPSTPIERKAFFAELAAEPAIRGLELPFYRRGGDPWPTGAAPGWTAVISAIPGTMQHLALDPYFGLASTDPQGRAAALRYTAGIHDYAKSLTAQGHPVEAIELHSAPRDNGSAEALATSLTEILTWDWNGARITLEHCDAPADGRIPEKGFLPLASEIAVLAELIANGHRTGLVVNWGRSVIESHNPHTAEAHIHAARQAGVLYGVMFSGCSPQETDYGYPWIDGHLPAREILDAPKSSLLTQNQISRCLEAAGSPAIVGFKIGQPASATAQERARRLRHMCALIRT